MDFVRDVIVCFSIVGATVGVSSLFAGKPSVMRMVGRPVPEIRVEAEKINKALEDCIERGLSAEVFSILEYLLDSRHREIPSCLKGEDPVQLGIAARNERVRYTAAATVAASPYIDSATIADCTRDILDTLPPKPRLKLLQILHTKGIEALLPQNFSSFDDICDLIKTHDEEFLHGPHDGQQ